MTPAQIALYRATIKADILANADMNTLPANSDGSDAIAKLYNAAPAVAMTVWRSEAQINDIFDAIDWSKYTPVDAPDGTTLMTNRVLIVQTKQMNLQNMTVGRTTLDCGKPNIRAGLRDNVIGLPSGTGGANVTAGGASGATVLAACIRNANRIEKLLAGTTATTGATTANLLGFEGTVTYQDIDTCRI